MNPGETFDGMMHTPTAGHPMYHSRSFYAAPPQPNPSLHQHDVFPMRPYMMRTYSLDGFGNYEMEHPTALITMQEKSQRSRRRNQPGAHPIKHRRTRSGCYTCRQRRIKCDEARPICDRCRKGKRDCTYPGASTSASQSRSSKRKGSTVDSAQSPQETEHSDHESDEKTEASGSQYVTPTQSFDDSAYSTQDEVAVRSTVATAPRPVANRPGPRRNDSHQTFNNSMQTSRWANLPQDVKILLTYHRDHLTEHHYGLRHDHGGHLKRTLLDRAINDESDALLYAVVAFANYHQTLGYGDSAISNFLFYHNKAIVLLQKSLHRGNPDLTTLLTILQLATIEECLGNWDNMFGHQRAAHGIISSLFTTPQAIASDPVNRSIAAWYMQFDLFNAMTASRAVRLDRSSFIACQNFCKRQTQKKPHDARVRFEEYYTTIRLIRADLAIFQATRSRDGVSSQDVQVLADKLLLRLADFGRELEAAFPDCPIITEGSPAVSPTFSHGELLDFVEPEPFYTGDLATMNYVLLDFWAMDLEVKSLVQHRPPIELASTALKIAGMIETMSHSTQEPAGATLSCRSSLVVASYFLPKESQYFNWVRRKFANIERLGYIFPASFRRHMFGLWGVHSDEGWTPIDDCSPPVMMNVRDWVDYRGQHADVTASFGDAESMFAGMSFEQPDFNDLHYMT